MAEEAAVKTWSRRFKLIVGGAAALTAVIGVATAAFSSYQSFLEAQRAREDTKTSYELLVSKVNSMAERLAFVEGACLTRSATSVSPAISHPTPTVSDPLPPPAMAIVTVDGDGILPSKAKPARAPRFKVQAYQQLPTSLDSLLKSKDAYAE